MPISQDQVIQLKNDLIHAHLQTLWFDVMQNALYLLLSPPCHSINHFYKQPHYQIMICHCSSNDICKPQFLKSLLPLSQRASSNHSLAGLI